MEEDPKSVLYSETLSIMPSNISSAPEEIRPTIYSQNLIGLGLIAFFILTIFFTISVVIERYNKWKSKRDKGNIPDSKEI